MKVFVGGLPVKHHQRARDAAPKNVKLTFESTDREPQAWARAAKNSAYCVLITKFMSHKYDETCESYGANVVRYRGTVHDFPKWLKALCESSDGHADN
jgi:hypothetical protein